MSRILSLLLACLLFCGTGLACSPANDVFGPSNVSYLGFLLGEVSGLEEAEVVFGRSIPIPSSVPEGYDLQRVSACGLRSDVSVMLLYSEGEIDLNSTRWARTWEEEFTRLDGSRLVLEFKKDCHDNQMKSVTHVPGLKCYLCPRLHRWG